jgi:DNA mismatch repair ATPase MutS
MMKCYYRIYSVEEYGEALRYSFGFEGYIDNLFGVSENLLSGIVNYANYIENTHSGSEPGSETSSTDNPRTPTIVPSSGVVAETKPIRRKQFSQFDKQYYPPHAGNGAIPNSCGFAKNIIISAPNAAGKTTLLKTTAINIIFSQQIGCGFYGGCTLLPYTHIHSYLNIPDTSGRDSLFQAESRRCKEIIDIVSSPENQYARHFTMLDELYSGTNPTEAGKSAYAFLKYLSKYDNVDFMLTTHYVYVCKKFKKSSKIANYKMGVKYTNPQGDYTFTYTLEPGISEIHGGMKILKDMDYPAEMLDMIRGT